MKLYVASSWRNLLQPGIVTILRKCGHEVYDFRNPRPGQHGFSWREIDPDWQRWTPEQYREAMKHPIAAAGYALDIGALTACDACVLVLPAGRSASWEFGYAMGMGKSGYVVQFEPQEPELMFREATILTNINELFDAFEMPTATETGPHLAQPAAARDPGRRHGALRPCDRRGHVAFGQEEQAAMTSTSHCRSCGASILWAETVNGRRMPLDEDPDPLGLFILDETKDPPVAEHVKGDDPLATWRDRERFTSHFATCPSADEHRRPR